MSSESPLYDIVSRASRKRRELGIFLVLVLAASLVLNYWVLPRTYRGTAMILPMSTPSGQATISADAVKTELMDPSFELLLLRRLSNIISVEEYTGGLEVTTLPSTGMVWVAFEGRDPSVVLDVLRALVPALNEAHAEQYATAVRGYEEALAALDKRIEAVQEKESKTPRLTANGTSSGEAGVEYMLQESYYNTLLGLDAQLTLQKNDIVTNYRASHQFQYIGTPGVLSKPVGPRKLFNTAVSVAVALLVGVAWAYFQKDPELPSRGDVPVAEVREPSQ